MVEKEDLQYGNSAALLHYKLHEPKAVTKLSSGENPKVRKAQKHATEQITLLS